MLNGKFKIGAKFGTAFAAVIAIFSIISLATFFSLKEINEADDWSTHTYKVLDHADVLLGSVINQETGVRGFLVSGDESFLGPYRTGRKDFQEALSELLHLTSDSPDQQKRLRQVEQLEEEWRTTIAEREIALMRNQASREEARAIESSGAGKGLMDQLRSTHEEFEEAERSLLHADNHIRTPGDVSRPALVFFHQALNN